MVVAAAAGGPIDVFGRLLAERMSTLLGQRVVIENVGGGGGTLGGQRVVNAAPDGYTALLGTLATHANPQLLGPKPLYNSQSDFVPVGLIAEIPLVADRAQRISRRRRWRSSSPIPRPTPAG